MKSALFALVLGFGFFNDVNAASKDLGDDLKGYKEVLGLVLHENQLPDEIINSLNEGVEKLHEAGIELPNVVNFYKELQELKKGCEEFDKSLKDFIESDEKTKVTLETLGLFAEKTSFVNNLKGANSLRVCEKPEELTALLGGGTKAYEISLGFYKNQHMISEGKNFFIIQSALEDLKPSEKYNELLTKYRNVKNKAATIARPLVIINNLSKSKDCYKDFSSLDGVEDILHSVSDMNTFLNNVGKSILEDSLFVLLYMDKVYNEYFNKSVAVFTKNNLDKKALLKDVKEDIKGAMSLRSNKPEPKTPSTSSSLGIFTNIIEEVKKAKAADPKLSTVDREEKIEESTKTITKTKMTVSAAPASAQKTLTANNSDKDTPLTLADLETNYKELHDALQIGGAGWWYVHEHCLADETEFGKLYRSNKDLQYSIRQVIYHANNLKEFFKVLKADTKFKNILSKIKEDDLLKTFMD